MGGGRVWADGPSPPPPVVSSVPLVREQPDDVGATFPEVFTACAVSRAMVRDGASRNSDGGNVKPEAESCLFSLSDVPFSVSLEDLRVEQRADPSLSSLFDQVLTVDEVTDSSRGYFIQDEVLVKKWVPHGDSFIGDPVFQVVVPAKLREYVLKLAHDSAGHWGGQENIRSGPASFLLDTTKKGMLLHT